MFFSKKKFLENAPSYVKKMIPKEHLIELDGKEVTFKEKFGCVEHYKVGNNDFYLYPVERSWCDTKAQTNLFEEVTE